MEVGLEGVECGFAYVGVGMVECREDGVGLADGCDLAECACGGVSYVDVGVLEGIDKGWDCLGQAECTQDVGGGLSENRMGMMERMDQQVDCLCAGWRRVIFRFGVIFQNCSDDFQDLAQEWCRC